MNFDTFSASEQEFDDSENIAIVLARIAAFDSGQMEAIPYEQVMQEMSEKYNLHDHDSPATT